MIASDQSLGAIIGRAEIMRSWRPGQHAPTFGANPVAVEAGIGTLEVIKSERLLENATEMGKVAMKRFSGMKERYELIGDVCGLGLFIGIERIIPPLNITGEELNKGLGVLEGRVAKIR